MIIIGVDFHPEFQQIALLNTTTGEVEEKRLAHPDEGEVLPCSRECGRDSAPWHGGQWARTLVRASDSRVAV